MKYEKLEKYGLIIRPNSRIEAVEGFEAEKISKKLFGKKYRTNSLPSIDCNHLRFTVMLNRKEAKELNGTRIRTLTNELNSYETIHFNLARKAVVDNACKLAWSDLEPSDVKLELEFDRIFYVNKNDTDTEMQKAIKHTEAYPFSINKIEKDEDGDIRTFFLNYKFDLTNRWKELFVYKETEVETTE